jgi:hypothetical protein
LNGYTITTDNAPQTATTTNKIILGAPARAAIPASGNNPGVGAVSATGTPGDTSCHSVSAVSNDGTLPTFTISFDPTTGITNKSCYGGADAKYLTGCNDSTTGNTVAKAVVGVW